MCTRFPFPRLVKASALRLALTFAIGAVSAPAFSQGGMYVSEFGSNQVRVINATGTSSTAWTGVQKPWGLALAPNNDLYVVEADKNQISAFGSGGTFLGSTQPALSGNGNQSHGVVGFRQGLLLSTDENTTATPDNIYRYPSPGFGSAPTGTLAPAQAALNSPVLMTIRAATGGTAGTTGAVSLIVSNQGNNSISFHNPNTGTVQNSYTDANLNRPHSTAILGNRMYVANFGANNILIYSLTGTTPTYLSSFNTNVSSPTDLMFDGNGFLYATMEGTGKVERYNPAGAFQSTFFSGLNTPKSLIISGNGSSQNNPVLPGSVSGTGAFLFGNVATGRWFDPPTNPGYNFAMTDSNGFASIDSLPLGFSSGMSVTASNGVLSNTYSGLNPGDAVDFTAFFGAGGATTFSVNGINPLTDPTDTMAFPIALSFTSQIASFSMTPQVVPEFGSGVLTGLASLALGGMLIVRRKRSA